MFQSKDNANLALIIWPLGQMCCSFTLVFTICEVGERVTIAFSEIDELIVLLDWYLFPKATWQILPIILTVAQKPVTFHGFGNISYTREAIKNVVVVEVYPT